MARPTLADHDKRSARLPALRMTPLELAATKDAAEALGLPLTTFARDMILDGQIVAGNDNAVIDPDTVLELRRIGNNLNQAVKRLHQVGEPSPVLEQTAKKLDTLLDLLIEKIL